MTRDVIDEAAANLAVHMTWIHGRVPGMYALVDGSLVLADAGLGTDTTCRRIRRTGGAASVWP